MKGARTPSWERIVPRRVLWGGVAVLFLLFLVLLFNLPRGSFAYAWARMRRPNDPIKGFWDAASYLALRWGRRDLEALPTDRSSDQDAGIALNWQLSYDKDQQKYVKAWDTAHPYKE